MKLKVKSARTEAEKARKILGICCFLEKDFKLKVMKLAY
jgi:hypothetical protein